MKALLTPPLPSSSKHRSFWLPPHGSALALAIAETARRHDGLVVAVTRDTHAAHTLDDDLRVFAGELPVLHFPDWETLPYDLFPPHPEIISQRIATLYQLPTTTRGVLVVPIGTLMQRLAPRSFITGFGLVLAVKQKLDIGIEQRRLESAGYRHVPQVSEPGDFAVRGALLDIFPMGSAQPYRVELFDDEIDSIRTFDPESQRSQEKVESVRLLPAREFPLTEESAKHFRNTLRERFPIDPRRCPVYQDLKEGATPAGIEYYLPLFFEKTETLFDYLGEKSLFVLNEGALDAATQFYAQAQSRYDQRAHDIERPILPVQELYLPPENLRERLNQTLRVEIVEKGRNEHAVALATQPAPQLALARKGEIPGAEPARRFARYARRTFDQTHGGRKLAGIPAWRFAFRDHGRHTRRWSGDQRSTADCADRAPVIRRTGAATASAQTCRTRSRRDHPRPSRSRDWCAGGARRSRCRPVSGIAQTRCRRRRRRISRDRIRQGRQAVRAGRATASGQPLFRRRTGTRAAAFAGR